MECTEDEVECCSCTITWYDCAGSNPCPVKRNKERNCGKFLHTYIELEVLGGALFDPPEQVTANHRDNSLLTFDLLASHHRVRLASSRLAVRKDADIVPGMWCDLMSSSYRQLL